MILVTGSNGQLGFDVVEELKMKKINYIGTTRNDFDITNYDEVEEYLLNHRPDCIIHCAAYTAVDKAEEQKELCYKVNVDGTENIARVCKKINCKLIYISTDYVFDGNKNEPYEVNDKPNPISVYGKSKYEGELKVQQYLQKYFIVRTSWVFGKQGNNFVKTMIRLGREKKEINVVADQIGSPTYTKDLAKLVCDMALTERYGIYHATNEGFCSWAEFAEEIMKQSGFDCKINYIDSSQYPVKAVRPLDSRLSKKFLKYNKFMNLRCWNEGLKDFLMS